MVVALRWVDDELSVHEEFIGLYDVATIEATSLVHVIKDTLLRLNLPMAKVRGQCYDGASNMSGKRHGVAKLIQDEEPRATFTHCYGHSLNIAAGDTIKMNKVMKSSLETTHEITKLVKYSPRRQALLRDIQTEMESGSSGAIRALCPTRWTVRADSMESIVKNYCTLQTLWDHAIDIVRDTGTIARIRGVASQMKSFSYFYGLVLGEVLLRHTDNLSRTLQKTISASEGQLVADMTRKTLQSMRNDEDFDLFWDKVNRMANDNDVDDPVLPRKRKAPQHLETGSAPAEFPATTKDHYRRIFFEVLDLLIQAIADRFDQPGYRTYSSLQALLLKAAKKDDFSEELKTVCKLYGSDLQASNLKLQLQILGNTISGNNGNIVDIKNHLQQLSATEKELVKEVILLMKLNLVLPATNAASERALSAMRRVKSYLRSTMSQGRLNHWMILHVHKYLTDKLPLVDVANDFVSKSPRREQLFGKF